MTYSEIIPGNRLIAAYLGAAGPDLFWLHQLKEDGKDQFTASELKFHNDWNWLMKAIDKIEYSLPDDSIITIEYKDCRIPVLSAEQDIIGHGETKIQAVWRAVVEFIKWVNNESK